MEAFGNHWSLGNESRAHSLHRLLLRVLTVMWEIGAGRVLLLFLVFFFSLSFFFRCEAEGYGSREHIHKSGFILSEARLCFFLWKKGTAKKDGKNTGLLLMCLCVVSSKSFLSLEIEHVVFILSRWVVSYLERMSSNMKRDRVSKTAFYVTHNEL